MATTKDKYFTKVLETLVNYNDRNNGTLSNGRIQQEVSRVMAETEEEEIEAELIANNMTMDTISPLHNYTIAPLHHFPVTNNSQG